MQSVFVIIIKLIASRNYFCEEVFCNNFGRDGNFGEVNSNDFQGGNWEAMEVKGSLRMPRRYR